MLEDLVSAEITVLNIIKIIKINIIFNKYISD